FQLDQAPLFKVHLVETEVDHYLLIVNAHHTIVDVLSLILMTKEIAQLYAGAPLAPLELHYKDFSQWQRQKLKAGGYAEAEKYWMKHLKDVPLLELPTDFPRPPVQKNYSEFLSEVNSMVLRNFSHSEYPFMNLVEKLKIQDPPDRSHFIDVVFNFINVQVPKVNLFGCETQ
ncbi:condensation domain-containing protein, partial [Coxiella burnetii]